MTDPIIAPYVPTYAATEPYISPAEFKASPTGVNVNQLAPGRDAAVNADELAQTIMNASGWADGLCNQTLACTTEILYGTFRVKAGGRIEIPTKQIPVVQVNAVSIGTANQLIPLTTLLGVTFPALNVVSIPYNGASNPVDVQMEYLAGFPNTFLTAASSALATVLLVSDTLGIQPGLSMQISDPGKSEVRTVLSVTTTTITFTTALTNAHDIGTNVTALPPAIKQAVILLTSVLIKTRGSQAYVLQSPNGGGGPTEIQKMDPAAQSQYGQAVSLLSNFRRVA